MDKNLRETTNLGVEIKSNKGQVKRKLGHLVPNSRLPFDVNVMRNLSINYLCLRESLIGVISFGLAVVMKTIGTR